MPLYKTVHHNPQTIVKIWKITESYDNLMRSITLKPENQERVSQMKSEIHQRGFLSVRHLLAAFGYADSDMYYDDNGKPHLKDGKYISITHSFIFSAIIISDVSVGIDVEKQRDKIKIIANKFADYEFQYLNSNHENYLKKLTTIWCAKESMYKLFATPGLSFKQHTLVIPFTLKEESTIAWIDYGEMKSRYKIHFFEFEGFSCAYALP